MNTTPFTSRISSYGLVLLLASIVCLIFTGITYFFLPPQIPLWHSLSLSELQLTQKEFIWIFPISMAFVSSITYICITMISSMDTHTKRIVWSGSVLALFVLYLAFAKVLVASL